MGLEVVRKYSSLAATRFRATLAPVVGHFGADMGMIHRLDPADRHLTLVATTDGVPEPVLAAARRIPLGKGVAGETALTGRTVSMCNLQTDTSGVARPGAKATGAQGTACVPVFQDDQVVGTLGIGVRGERTFTEAEAEELLAAARAGRLARARRLRDPVPGADQAHARDRLAVPVY